MMGLALVDRPDMDSISRHRARGSVEKEFMGNETGDLRGGDLPAIRILMVCDSLVTLQIGHPRPQKPLPETLESPIRGEFDNEV